MRNITSKGKAMSTIAIGRVVDLPDPYEPSTIYITKTRDPRYVDLHFTNNDGTEIRNVLNDNDVLYQIMDALELWVPRRSHRADKWTSPITFNLGGAVTGNASINGSSNVTIKTKMGSGDGDVGSVIEYDGYIPYPESGGQNWLLVPLVNPFPEWPEDPSNYTLLNGDLIRITGSMMLSVSDNYRYGYRGPLDAWAAWDIDATIMVNNQGKAQIIASNIVKLGDPDSDPNEDYTLTIKTVNSYTPTPEEAYNGFVAKPAAFWIDCICDDWRGMWDHRPHVIGKLDIVKINAS